MVVGRPGGTRPGAADLAGGRPGRVRRAPAPRDGRRARARRAAGGAAVGRLRGRAPAAAAARQPQAARRDGRRTGRHQRPALARGSGAAEGALRAGRRPARQGALRRRRRQAVPVPDALVYLHRRARLRQDHRADPLGPALPAGRGRQRRSHQGRRRHPQLRLVVYRRSGVPRHGRALHHPGQRPRGRCRRLAGLPRAAEKIPPGQPAERRHPDPQPVGPADPGRAVAGALCRRRAQPGGRAVREARHPLPDLCHRHQGRPAGRLQRILCRPRPGRTGPGMGRDVSAPAGGGAGVQFCRCLQARLRRPRKTPQRRPHRTAAGRARPAAARRHLQLPATAQPDRPAGGALPRADLPGQPLQPAAAAARRVFHQRHPGGHAARPRARHAGALAQSGAQDRGAGRRQRQELLPGAPAARGGVSRGRAGRLRRAPRAPQPLAAGRRLCRAGAVVGDAAGGMGAELLAQRATGAGGRHAPAGAAGADAGIGAGARRRPAGRAAGAQ